MNDVPHSRWLALNYAAAIFTSAFLLFQIQPLITKHILPWFGGGPAVWTTCLLFFQTLLFFGYAYAHLLNSRFSVKRQAIFHIGLIVAAIALGSILPGARWEPRGGESPVRSILLILAVSVGLPYFVLSATGPLLQAWFARSFPGRSPYRLYALSNLGSLLALVSYPFFFERRFDVPRQAFIWSAGFVLYGLLCAYAAWRLVARSRVSPTREKKSSKGKKNKPQPQGGEARNPEAPIDVPSSPPRLFQRILWLVLPAFASVVLMATTNHISTDIAVMPFLWIVPLALYLITFIIAFDRPAWYRQLPVAVLMIASIYGTALVHHLGVGTRKELFDAGTLGLLFSVFAGPGATSPGFHITTLQFLVINFTSMFAICMLCHGELVRQRPDPRYLTSFYLMISAGGALGGAFVSLLAPRIFNTYYEWQLSLFIACVLAVGVLLRALVMFIFADDSGPRRMLHYAMLGVVVLAVFLPSAVMLLDMTDFLQPPSDDAPLRTRNFFGTLTVLERGDPGTIKHGYLLKHGAITHGAQFSHPTRRSKAISYYGPMTGVARTIDYYRREVDPEPMNLAVVGLGTGSLAAFADRGDNVVFYEIDPAVIKITESARWFTYLRDCRARGAHCEIRLGDARLTMRRELESNSPPLGGERLGEGGIGQRYHVIVLDAFSGDSVPAHLLTVEAFQLYLAHLRPPRAPASAGQATGADLQGAIAVHVSNRFLDLKAVVLGIAQHFGLSTVRIDSDDVEREAPLGADWMILTYNERLVSELSPFSSGYVTRPPLLWTDTHSSMFDIMK